MARKKKTQADESGLDFNIGDIGIETPDFDTSLFDILEDGEGEETRYIKPKVYATSSDFVKYDNAEKLARDIEITTGARYDVVVNGSFIFGDFLEAFIVRNNAKCKRFTISTLSLNQNNVDSLHNLITHGYVDELNLIVSAYFYNMEIRALIPYIYRQLDIDNRLQLAVANVHTKTAQFETLGGKKIIAHGSANLRSSGSIEQFTIEENAELYDFYDNMFSRILERYQTIRKPVWGKKAWAEIIKKKFND
ncbi:hypothetical protein [Bacteroides congonensis]|jgi:hypothetical protein|uniref:hypothetical protein n=1 Tax=Bacteroides congonensis TaxID=1871006 RepID=UPI0025B75594|nr:hypothetical protein [Bacteroides congonensis]